MAIVVIATTRVFEPNVSIEDGEDVTVKEMMSIGSQKNSDESVFGKDMSDSDEEDT